jgi:gamma-glutamyltranspeptidase / glutathione hydrolase
MHSVTQSVERCSLPASRWPRWLIGAACGLASVALAQNPPELPSGWTPKEIVFTNKDMVVAANPLAVDAGVEILRAGGSATDAAIAVQMVLNLVEPQSSGIGGGAFMLHYDAAIKKLETYDGRETAPAAAGGNLFLNANGTPQSFATRVGGRSVGTPGLLRMLELVHKEKGKLPWARLFEPAIRLADAGFAISPRLFSATSGDAAQSAEPKLNAQPLQAPAYFYNADGSPKAVGTVLRNPDLAATFRTIASGGADAFYKGEIARDIVAAVANHPTNPGVLSEADLAGYQAKKREPVCTTYRTQWNVCTMGAPSSAMTVLMTLSILENFDVAAMGAQTVDSTHLIAEAYRLAYADRALYMADADFYPVPTAGLLDKNYLKSRAATINMARSMGAPVAGTPPGVTRPLAPDFSADLPGTSHVSIVDRNGNVVTMTTTIESAFGAKQMLRGFLLNNELTDFSFVPTSNGLPVANRVEPNKRPRSSMAPAIVFDSAGRVQMVVGSPGGSNIIQYVTKTIIGVLDWKLNVQDAINLGNFGAQTSATTSLERGSPNQNLRAGLEARGHTVTVGDINSGIHGIVFDGKRDTGNRNGLFAIVKPRSGWAGGADPRREGVAKGQ